MVTKTWSCTIDEAISAWDELRASWLWSQDKLEHVISIRAWEPLGYESFFEAWDDKMSDISLAREVNIRVVAQFLEEGMDVDRIAETVKGVGPETVRNVKREIDNGVPGRHARGARVRSAFEKPIYVRPHGREKASPDSVIHVKVGPTMKAEYDRIAHKLGRSVEDIAKEGIEQKFAELAKVK